ncbi:MAG: hypothetical protein ACRD1B_04035, partial [Thermoanaerobaculia bacterium]
MIEILRLPPRDWDAGVNAPCVTAGFARAMASMGYGSLFLRDGGNSALALVRGAAPGLGWLTARANLYAPGAGPAFVREAIGVLKGRGIPTVKVGDSMWGVPWGEPGADWP